MTITSLREMLRLLLTSKLTNRRIGRIVKASRTTVMRYRKLCLDMNFQLSELYQLSDEALANRFSATRSVNPDKRMPDWVYIHKRMAERHQTLMQLWEEYRASRPEDAYAYSQFTFHYRQYVRTIDLSMRQSYLPGEVVFVDFAGKRPSVIDANTGVAKPVELFIGVLGYSQYVFAYAVASQRLDDWVEAHQQMFDFMGGTPQVVVPDNLKSAVTVAGRLPTINRTYLELAKHYGCVIEPARVRRPQDKSLAEIGVLLVTRWITVVLKRRRFFSLEELNDAIAELLPKLNQRAFKRYEGSRASRFEEKESTKLQPLPTKPFECGHWLPPLTVPRDYHVYVQGHAYSVPFRYVGEKIEARVGAQTVALFHQGRQIALHPRSDTKGEATTNPDHRPVSHKAFAQQSKAHFHQWATSIGPAAVDLVLAQFEAHSEHSLKGCRASSKLQKLCSQYGPQRFERACLCACDIQSRTVSSVRSILQCHLDKQEDDNTPVQKQLPLHHNVRGPGYYSDPEVES